MTNESNVLDMNKPSISQTVIESLNEQQKQWQSFYDSHKTDSDSTNDYRGQQTVNWIAGFGRLTAFALLWTCVFVFALSVIAFLSIEGIAPVADINTAFPAIQKTISITSLVTFGLLFFIGLVWKKGQFRNVANDAAVDFANRAMEQGKHDQHIDALIDERLIELKLLDEQA